MKNNEQAFVIENLKCTIQNDKEISIPNQSYDKTIVFFYPRDNTPGCTTENMDFSSLYQKFLDLNCILYGISRDSIKSHVKFKEKYKLEIDLISDEKEEICKKFDVIKMKNMYGKQVKGIERSTFILNKNGLIIHEWRGIKVKGHADEVLNFLQNHDQ